MAVKLKAAYGAKSLRSLPYPESVQQRPGMYIGSVDSSGAFRCLKEIIDNSIDEAGAGFGTYISISYNTETGVITVVDNGRGVPMGWNDDEGKFASEVVYSTLHGSGKFDDESYGGTSAGLNGVGAAVCNAMSEWFIVWSSNTENKKQPWLMQRFEFGKKVHDPKPEAPKSKFALKTGRATVVKFKLNSKLFTDTTIDVERIHSEMSHIAMLNPGVTIAVNIDGEVTKHLSENGLIDMIANEKTKSAILGKPFSYQVEGLIDFACAWVDDTETVTHSYVNSSYTVLEGKHVDGARAAIIEAVKGELSERDKGGKGDKDKDKAKIDPKFFLKGLRIAMNWRMKNPVYAGQTKDKLNNAEVLTKVRNELLAPLVEFLKKNKSLASGIIDRAKKFQKIDAKFSAEMKSVKSLTLRDPSACILPGKLVPALPCYSRDEKELILVEGDSAGTPCSEMKMPWQEVLPLRGKVLNASTNSIPKLLGSDAIRMILTCMGVTPGDMYDTKTRRVARVCLLPDADSDGAHICSLLLALFGKVCPDWFATGNIFYINAPLFVGRHLDDKHYGNTKEEVFDQFLPKVQKNVMISRMKGWGEAKKEDLQEFALNPSTRVVTRMSMTDADLAIMNEIMGDDPAKRRELLGLTEVK